MDLGDIIDDLIIPDLLRQKVVIKSAHSHHLAFILLNYAPFDEISQALVLNKNMARLKKTAQLLMAAPCS
jgi:hypothetical protein